MDVVEFQKTMTGSLGFKGDHKVLKEIFKEIPEQCTDEAQYVRERRAALMAMGEPVALM